MKKMKNEYKFVLFNAKADGVPYDIFYETNLRRGRKWATGRGETIVRVWKNGEPFLCYRTK